MKNIAKASAIIIPPTFPIGVDENTVCIPFILIQHWNGHIIPIIIFITFELNTSTNLGIFSANIPNTIQASVLPIAQSRYGIIPLFWAVVTPFNKLPAFAQVAAILIA